MDATTNHLAWGWVWKGEWNSVVRDNLLFEVRAGQFGADRSETPNGTADRFEDIATLVARGGNRDWQRDLRRSQVAGSLSYFKDDWLGDHHVKVGGEVLRILETEAWRSSYPRDVLHVLSRGTPLDVYLFGRTPSLAASGLWVSAAYVSDSWRVNRRLTLNLGLRFDRFQVFLPEQQHLTSGTTPQTFPAATNVMAWNLPTPRIGATYDMAGDGRSIVKFNFGKYGVTPGTELGFSANPNASLWWQRYRWVDWNRNDVWDQGEEDRSSVIDSRGGTELEALDPELDLPFVREAAGWVERELGSSVGLRMGVVWRGERPHYMRQNVRQPFDAFSVPVAIPDPGPDGTSGTGDDGPEISAYALSPDVLQETPQYVVRNVADADSSYLTWEVGASRRFRGRWSFAASFAHTWSRDQANAYSGQPVRQNPYPLSPERPHQRGRRRSLRFQDLVRQGVRHLRRTLGHAGHAGSAASVRTAVRAHARGPAERHGTSGFSPSRLALAGWIT